MDSNDLLRRWSAGHLRLLYYAALPYRKSVRNAIVMGGQDLVKKVDVCCRIRGSSKCNYIFMGKFLKCRVCYKRNRFLIQKGI